MLTLRVTSFNGSTPERPIEARFDVAGGTIGRADDNQLVLPDSTRHISRLHARVVFDSGAFTLLHQGGNPIEVNGKALGQGRSVGLRGGDQLRIGGYVIRVDAPEPAAAERPLRDPFDRLGAPTMADDPLGLSLGVKPSATPAMSPPSRGGIPTDFDPFPSSSPMRPTASPALPDDLDLGLIGSANPAQSLDAMFDLGAKPGDDPFAKGPLSNTVPPSVQPGEASLDPLAPWQPPAPAVASAPVADRTPEIEGSFRPPAARPERPASPSARQSTTDMFLSWDDNAPALPPAQPAPDPLLGMFGDEPADRGTSVDDPLRLGASLPPRNPATASARSLPPASGDATAMPTAPRPLPPPVVRASVPGAATEGSASATDDLTRAFLAGLGMDKPPLAALSPESMEQLGQLLREATQGTLDLLVARAMTKREVRAAGTMIVGSDNNPLKFSPNAEAALAHLLGPPVRGFMPPVAAMRDAYDDLRAHQFGFMAGLRAALAGVLKRFDPAVLEQRLTHKSMLDSLLPMNRRAKLWDLYEQLYREVAREAEDDFHTLFGREFLRAYEEQVARLESAPDSTEPGR